jgi:hypothetical protein
MIRRIRCKSETVRLTYLRFFKIRAVIYTKVSASACAFSVPFVLTCRLENRRVSFHP